MGQTSCLPVSKLIKNTRSFSSSDISACEDLTSPLTDVRGPTLTFDLLLLRMLEKNDLTFLNVFWAWFQILSWIFSFPSLPHSPLSCNMDAHCPYNYSAPHVFYWLISSLGLRARVLFFFWPSLNDLNAMYLAINPPYSWSNSNPQLNHHAVLDCPLH